MAKQENAVVAQGADQALGHHQLQRQRHHPARHPHVDQAGWRRGGIVGVQGREHQVPRHGRTQAGQVGAATALGDVVGEAQHGFVVAIVPLHRHLYADLSARDAAIAVGRPGSGGVKGVGMKNFLVGVDEVDKAFDTART